MQHLHDRNDRQTIPGRQAPNSLPPIELEIVLGQARNRMRPVRQRNFRLGRSESCDLVLSDAAIDDVAAYILSTPQGVWIRQVGSNTPLLVNERAVGTMLLLNHDRIRIGPFEFRVHIGSSRPAHLPPAAPAPTARQMSLPAAQAGQSRRLDGEHPRVPVPKFVRRATAVSRGKQHALASPPSWPHMSHEINSE
ncbi:MAG: FHA domain-containing protein [Planctomycetota bacterium]|nr:MAG: FHA domain-containing protein [Planctomycetota bacterium]REK43311.1 MAG: FHA domain-containing protein [Planctomycetota bacterium]